jgi:hypothetical protein
MIGGVIFLAVLGTAQPVNMQYRMPPMAQMDCRVGCVRDANGGDCAWQFVTGEAPPLLGTDPDADEEQTLTLACESLPVAVQTAFQKLFPKAVVSGCVIEEEFGKNVYEVTSTEDTIRRDVLLNADGGLVAIAEAIAAADVPEAVQQAWDKQSPKHNIVLVEKVIRDNLVTYEFQATRLGKPVEVVFDESGKELITLSPGTR